MDVAKRGEAFQRPASKVMKRVAGANPEGAKLAHPREGWALSCPGQVETESVASKVPE